MDLICLVLDDSDHHAFFLGKLPPNAEEKPGLERYFRSKAATNPIQVLMPLLLSIGSRTRHLSS